MEVEYRCDYAYHAQMEPLNAIASVSPAGDAVEIWAGTQSQTIATEAPAKLLGIAEGQGQAQRHADGRRLRPARQPRRRFHHRRRADVEGSRPAGEGDVDARGRRPQRPLPPDLGARPEGGIRPVRQARRLAAPRRRRPRRRLHGPGALPGGRRQGLHRDAGRGPQGLRRPASTGRAALPRHRRAHQSAARHQLHWPTGSPPNRSSTRSRASAASILLRSISSC